MKKMFVVVFLVLASLAAFAQSTSNAVPFTVTVPQVTAVLSSVAPNSASAGAAPVTITIAGSGFVSGSKAFFETTALTTTFVSATQLTAVIPTSLLVVPAGQSSKQYNITVQNPVTTAQTKTVTLSWKASTTTNVNGYLVRRDGALLTSNPLASLSYDDLGVPSGTYSYSVTAVAGSDESLPATVGISF